MAIGYHATSTEVRGRSSRIQIGREIVMVVNLQTEIDQSLLHTLKSLLFRKQLLPNDYNLWVLGKIRQAPCMGIGGAEAEFLE